MENLGSDEYVEQVVGCYGKKAYVSYIEATKSSRRLVKSRKRRGGGGTFNVYRCAHCRWWHVGSHTEGITASRKKRRDVIHNYKGDDEYE